MKIFQGLSQRSRQNRLILAAIVILIIFGVTAGAIGWSMRPPELPAPPDNAATETMPNKSTNEATGPSLSYSKPKSIRIPAMDLPATKLMHLGQNPNGTVKVPLGKNTNEPAWYDLGPAPGQIGPAMLMGHSVDENNDPSIFFNLSKLRSGDKVYIPREDGKTAIFTITGVKTFDKNKFPTDMIYGPTNHSAIRLVTCGGLGDDTQLGEYTQNVIAFGKLTGSQPSN